MSGPFEYMTERIRSAPSGNYNRESGNVLFLILIAVILFGALSFAVSSTSRTGSMGIEEESHDMLVSQISQYGVSINTAVQRMAIRGAIERLQFNPPSDFDNLTAPENGVFHPYGGNAVYINNHNKVMDGGGQSIWYFNAEFEIDQLGLAQANSAEGNELIAFLPGILFAVCRAANRKYNIEGIPNITSDVSTRYSMMMDHNYTFPNDEIVLGAAGNNGTDALTGHHFGCFQNNGGEYVYYHVLLVR